MLKFKTFVCPLRSNRWAELGSETAEWMKENLYLSVLVNACLMRSNRRQELQFLVHRVSAVGHNGLSPVWQLFIVHFWERFFFIFMNANDGWLLLSLSMSLEVERCQMAKRGKGENGLNKWCIKQSHQGSVVNLASFLRPKRHCWLFPDQRICVVVVKLGYRRY